GAAAHDYTIERFARYGIGADRIKFAANRPEAQYLKTYDEIDIALDPFPFNGDNTTCDALWCGVPVVTLAGNSFISRRGVSHLSAVGLSQLIASSPSQYAAKAVSLAVDLTALESLRSTLRQRILKSPLCDVASF